MNMGRIVRHKPTPTSTGFGYSENTLFDVIAILHRKAVKRPLAKKSRPFRGYVEPEGGDWGELK